MCASAKDSGESLSCADRSRTHSAGAHNVDRWIRNARNREDSSVDRAQSQNGPKMSIPARIASQRSPNCELVGLGRARVCGDEAPGAKRSYDRCYLASDIGSRSTCWCCGVRLRRDSNAAASRRGTSGSGCPPPVIAPLASTAELAAMECADESQLTGVERRRFREGAPSPSVRFPSSWCGRCWL
jgi:hypothetical protein